MYLHAPTNSQPVNYWPFGWRIIVFYTFCSKDRQLNYFTDTIIFHHVAKDVA